MIKNTVNLLGLKAKDRVTGFRGVITSACFDLYGCVQVALTPEAGKNAKTVEPGHWFDVGRVEVTADRVMAVPSFEARSNDPRNYDKGPAEKGPPKP